MSDPIRARPIARSEIYRFGCAVEARLAEASGEYRLYYQVKLSTLLNPKEYQEETFRNEIYRRTAGLAVCRIDRSPSRAKKRVVAACDVSGEWTQVKENIFQSANIDYFKLDTKEFGVGVDLVIASVLNTAKSQPTAVPKINTRLTRGEDQGYRHLRGVLNKQDVAFFAELSLEDALYLPDHERAHIEKRVATFNKRASKTVSSKLNATLNFDGTVATMPPYSFPLFFVEYDGGAHRIGEPNAEWTPEQKAQHEKDQIKNQICEKSQVPLFRVHDDDTTDTQRANEIISLVSEKITKRMLETDGFFGSLLGAIESEIDALGSKDKITDTKVLVSLLRTHRKVLVGRSTELKDALTEERRERDNDREMYENLLQDSLWSNSRPEDEEHDAQMSLDLIDAALKLNREDLFRVDIHAMEGESGYTICAIGIPVDNIVALPGPCTSTMRIPIRVYAIPTIRKIFMDALEDYGRRKLAPSLLGQLSCMVLRDKSEIEKRIADKRSAIMAEEEARTIDMLTKQLIRARNDDERLETAKKHIGDPEVVLIPEGATSKQQQDKALSFHKWGVQYGLHIAITALSRVQDMDPSGREIIENELKEYVRTGLANVRFEDRKMFVLQQILRRTDKPTD